MCLSMSEKSSTSIGVCDKLEHCVLKRPQAMFLLILCNAWNSYCSVDIVEVCVCVATLRVADSVEFTDPH